MRGLFWKEPYFCRALLQKRPILSGLFLKNGLFWTRSSLDNEGVWCLCQRVLFSFVVHFCKRGLFCQVSFWKKAYFFLFLALQWGCVVSPPQSSLLFWKEAYFCKALLQKRPILSGLFWKKAYFLALQWGCVVSPPKSSLLFWLPNLQSLSWKEAYFCRALLQTRPEHVGHICLVA